MPDRLAPMKKPRTGSTPTSPARSAAKSTRCGDPPLSPRARAGSASLVPMQVRRPRHRRQAPASPPANETLRNRARPQPAPSVVWPPKRHRGQRWRRLRATAQALCVRGVAGGDRAARRVRIAQSRARGVKPSGCGKRSGSGRRPSPAAAGRPSESPETVAQRGNPSHRRRRHFSRLPSHCPPLLAGCRRNPALPGFGRVRSRVCGNRRSRRLPAREHRRLTACHRGRRVRGRPPARHRRPRTAAAGSRSSRSAAARWALPGREFSPKEPAATDLVNRLYCFRV